MRTSTETNMASNSLEILEARSHDDGPAIIETPFKMQICCWTDSNLKNVGTDQHQTRQADIIFKSKLFIVVWKCS